VRMNHWITWCLAGALVLCSAACGDKKADLQKGSVLPDKTLYENGLKYLDDSQYIKARLSFQTLINTYDDSPYLETSKYYIAYSYLREGGVENLIQAEQAFKDFKLFFPTSELADNAQAFIVQINMRMMKEPNRDLTYAQRSEVELKNFLVEFPDSPFVPEIRSRQYFVDNVLATSSYLKGKFYHNRNHYKAATSRFRDCVQKFSSFGKRDEALFLLADSLDRLKNFDESAVYYAQIVRGYPFSEYFEEAKDRLRKLEKPIPEVDQRLAGENEKLYEPDGSTFTSPFRIIFSSMGIGVDRPWEELEEQRVEAERARVKALAPGEVKDRKDKDKGSE